MGSTSKRCFHPETECESDDESPSHVKRRNRPAPSTRSYNMIAMHSNSSATDLEKWARIRRMKPSGSRYKDIQLYLQNSCGGVQAKIDYIYKIERYGERQPFERSVYRMMLWHGTSPQAVSGIIQTGFRMGSRGLYGGGIYFADRFAKSAPYCQKTSGGTAFLFVVEVELGKVYKAHHTHSDYKTAPPGFDTVKGNGREIPTWRQNRLYHGAILPCGESRPNPRFQQYDLPYNEYILYDPNRVIVRFLVQCRF